MLRFNPVPGVIVLYLCALLPAGADTVSLTPVADTFLQEAYPDNNLGGGTTIAVGERRKGGATRSLILFDITANVPAGATITSASVVFTVTSTPGGGADSIFDLHRITAAWGEGDGSDRFGGSSGMAGQATWNDRLGPGTPWTSPGGDFVPGVSSSKFITGNGVYTFNSTASLVQDIQAWLDNPSTNFGWALVSESESTPTTIRRLGSREDSSTAPVLVLQYNVPEPETLALLCLGIATLLWKRNAANC